MEIPRDNSKPAHPQAEEAVLTTPEGHALPRVLDPVVTMDLVQRYVESERIRSRRMLILTGTLFLFVVLILFAAFLSIGIYVLQNSRRATQMTADLQAQTMGYTVEMVSISNQVDSLMHRQKEVREAVQVIEGNRTKESRILKSDLERFSAWVASNDNKGARFLSEMETQVKQMQETSAATAKELATVKEQYAGLLARLSDVSTARPAETSSLVTAGDGRPGGGRDEPERGLGSVTSSIPLLEDEKGEEQTTIEPRPERPQGEISVVTFPSGDRYEGEFSDGFMSGWGVYSYRSGDKYEGEFRNDMKNGKGTFSYRNGDKYIGEFKDDMKNGRGSCLFHGGDKYVGEFKNDTVSGKGTMQYSNGNKYSGDFRNGLKHGNGMFAFVNGDVYEGDFKEDVREGRGTYIFCDGTKYIGDFKNGQRHGKGRYIYAGGEEYVGEFTDGKKDGAGVCIYPDGKTLKGLWKEDRLIKTLES